MPPHSSPIPLAQHIPTLIFLAVTVLTSNLISRTQPTPYIDEIFHIPQAQRFCSALASTPLSSLRETSSRLRSVEYDAKLTTPPGLYAISVGLAKLLPGWECSDVVWLRATNLVLLLTLPVLISRILRQNEEAVLSGPDPSPSARKETVRQPAKKKPISRSEIVRLQQKAKLETPLTPAGSHDSLPDLAAPTVRSSAEPTPRVAAAVPLLPAPKRKEASPYTMAVACTICFLPPLWFFGFLYYTDLASIWLVLACLTLYNDLNLPTPSSSHFTNSALITLTSVLAVLVRQTNIVWVAFCAAQALLSRVLTTPSRHSAVLRELSAVVGAAVGKERGKFWKLVTRNAAPLVPMLVGCAWFVRWNGSIVLGDKSNHQAGLHLPQLGYFIAFASGFGVFPLLFSLSSPGSAKSDSQRAVLPALIDSIRSAVTTVASAMVSTVSGLASLTVVLASFYWAVERYTIDHPFLLADSRHYTFYVWRAFRKTYALPGLPVAVEPRFALVPVYALGLFGWTLALRRARRGALFSVMLWGATAATLVPTPLVEPRYYLLSYALLRIYMHTVSGGEERRLRLWYLALEVLLYAVVNMVTVGLFVAKPFEWASSAVDQRRGEGTTMRFIW